MVCPKCKSTNINVVAVTETKKKKHNVAYWIFVGWWWWIIDGLIWIFALIPRLIWRSGNKSETKTHTEAICQDCGYRWKI